MTTQEDQTGKVKNGVTQGLDGIFTGLENFFSAAINAMIKPETNGRHFIQRLEGNAKGGLQLIAAGRQLLDHLKSTIRNVEKLLDRIPCFEDGFQMVSKGLKGINDLSEEATTKIQDTSTQMQDSLEKLVSELTKLSQDTTLDKELQLHITQVLKTGESVSNQVFDIMIQLQFQDILRQQLSAVNMVLAKTKNNIGLSLEKIQGKAIKPWEQIEMEIVTDESILQSTDNQENVDVIIKSTNKC